MKEVTLLKESEQFLLLFGYFIVSNLLLNQIIPLQGE